MRWIRHAPVTAETIVICVAVFVSCSIEVLSGNERFGDVQREWGAIRSLQLHVVHDGVRRPQNPELFGPFDIWEGQFWRIPLTAFHHADLWHLVLNLGAMWYLGRHLERYWGSVGMLLFLFPAICVPIMAELCTGNAVIGFSGATCAILGALAVIRSFDRRMADAISVETIEIGVAAILLGWLATLSEFVAFANVAHVIGFLYGAAIAAAMNGPLRRVILLRLSVVLAHVWFFALLIPVVYPSWNGRFHWYQASVARDFQLEDQFLERASRCDPSLTGVWLRWAEIAEEKGDPLRAWIRLVKGVASNPSNVQLIDGLRRQWRHFDLDDRRDAEGILRKTFGKRASVWLSQIRNIPSRVESKLTDASDSAEAEPDISEFSLDQIIELSPLDGRRPSSNRQKRMIPENENNAVEGESL